MHQGDFQASFYSLLFFLTFFALNFRIYFCVTLTINGFIMNIQKKMCKRIIYHMKHTFCALDVIIITMQELKMV